MAEPRPFEDEATLYVLDRLGRAKRRRFEARLKTSPELRTLVRELEAGTVALTLAMPPHQPPAQVWNHIHEAVARETERKVVARFLWFALFRGGWAAAACVMIGWLIYMLWVNFDSHEMSSAILSGELSHSNPEPRGVANAETPGLSPQPHRPPNIAPAPGMTPPARPGEIAALRREIRDLEDQVAHMSQVLTQQQTFPSSPGQLAFFHLLPTPADGTAARAVKSPSPELQRALLIGMARELGWLRPSTPAPANAEKQLQPESEDPHKEPEAAEIADLGVKFVDLPAEPGGQPPAAPPIGKEEAKKLKSILAEPPPTASAETATSNLSESPTPEESVMPTESAIPAFRSGTNLVLAIDSSVVPSSGTNPVTVWTAPASASFQVRDWAAAMAPVNGTGSTLSALGTFTVGNSPTLLTIPLSGPIVGAPGTVIFTVGGAPNRSFSVVLHFSPSP